MATGAVTTSGIDVNSIVEQLMTVEQRPLAKFDTKEAGYQAKLAAYGNLRGALDQFKTKFSSLEQLSTFQATKATFSDPTLATATGLASAPPGTYNITVQQLAQAQKLATGSYTTTDAAIGTGALSFQLGTYASGTNTFTPNSGATAKTVSIAAGQQSLAGVRDAVNAANIGVTASIVNDGTANRLVFSPPSGTKNTLKLAVSDADGNSTDAAGLSALAFDPTAATGAGKNLTEVQSAQDGTAIIDGITVKSSTNQIASAIEGVTINLIKASAASATLTVARDTGSIKTAVQSFVDGYNEVMKSLKDATFYDPQTKRAGPLQGDSTALRIQGQLRSLVGAQLSGGATALTRLSDIGVSFERDGTLKLDATKLQTKLDADPRKIAQLFAKAGQTSDSRVEFIKASNRTVAGDYPISVTQAATQGTVVGGSAASLIIATGVNDVLNVVLDSRAASITLPARTYATADELAADLQARINGASAITGTGAAVKVTQSSGVLSISSNAYGSISGVTVSGTAATSLFGVSTSTTGLNVAGTIGGSPASGSGQTLTAVAGSANDLSLKLNVTTPGEAGKVTYFNGYAARLDDLLGQLSGTNGGLKARTDGVNKSIRDVGKQRDALNTRLVQVEKNYRRQFSGLDRMLSSMNTTSNYLAQQLSSLTAQSQQR